MSLRQRIGGVSKITSESVPACLVHQRTTAVPITGVGSGVAGTHHAVGDRPLLVVRLSALLVGHRGHRGLLRRRQPALHWAENLP